jgi:hypothetical protein
LTRKNTNVWDEKDGGIVSRTPKQRTAFIHKTIRFLAVSTPTLFEKICSKYLLFDQFLKGKREGIDGLPYIELASNKNAVAFMSADIPKGKKYHVLVIARIRILMRFLNIFSAT